MSVSQLIPRLVEQSSSATLTMREPGWEGQHPPPSEEAWGSSWKGPGSQLIPGANQPGRMAPIASAICNAMQPGSWQAMVMVDRDAQPCTRWLRGPRTRSWPLCLGLALLMRGCGWTRDWRASCSCSSLEIEWREAGMTGRSGSGRVLPEIGGAMPRCIAVLACDYTAS